MAGTWMSIVEGFGGLRIQEDTLSFTPKIPKEWKGYTFNVNFRDQILKVNITQKKTSFNLEGDKELTIIVHGKKVRITPNNLITI